MIKILSIDGGGLRGIIPVLVLKYIEEITQKRICDIFDLISGTSTGALIACGLTMKKHDSDDLQYNIREIETLYRTRGQEIFPSGGKFNQWLERQPLANFFGPRFTPDGLQKVLKEFLTYETEQEALLSHCIKPLIIPAYDIISQSPVFFKSRYATNNQSRDPKLFDVCRATSAAPTFLPPYNFSYPHEKDGVSYEKISCIDGGMYINNPTMAALVEIFQYHADYGFESLEEEEVYVLSIGTGTFGKDISKDAHHWGKRGWISPLIEIMMLGNSQMVDYQAKEVLKYAESDNLHYLRINVNIGEEKYADMALSTTDAINYWSSLFTNGYLENLTKKEELNQFLSYIGA